MVPRTFEAIAKNEIKELHNMDILTCDIATAYGFSTCFHAKKDDGVRVVSDLRKLNKVLERSPYLLPNIDKVIWKVGGLHSLHV